MTKIICLCGGPGVGKSTVSTGVFTALKQRRISSEYVSEYAKEITWEGTHKLLENQIHVFAEQYRRQFRLLNKVEYVVTDSPLLFNSIYFDYYNNSLEKPIFSREYADLSRTFFDETFKQFDNLIYYLARKKLYDPNGRNQTLEEAQEIDEKIIEKLDELQVPCVILTGTEKENIETILEHLGV